MLQAMKCPNCGALIRQGSERCDYCGTWVRDLRTAEKNEQNDRQSARRTAPHAAPETEKVRVIHETKVVYVPQTNAQSNREICSDRSRIVALVLCVLFGWFGGHRFYLGKWGTGLLYAVTFGLYGIGWVIDGIILLLGHPKDGAKRPLRW